MVTKHLLYHRATSAMSPVQSPQDHQQGISCITCHTQHAACEAPHLCLSGELPVLVCCGLSSSLGLAELLLQAVPLHCQICRLERQGGLLHSGTGVMEGLLTTLHFPTFLVSLATLSCRPACSRGSALRRLPLPAATASGPRRSGLIRAPGNNAPASLCWTLLRSCHNLQQSGFAANLSHHP